MPTHVAFLRGINVGGHRVKMGRLRELCAGLGLEDVSTFIASGNVVFSSGGAGPEELEARIAEGLEEALGYAVATMVRSIDELTEIVAHAHGPAFGQEGLVEGEDPYVVFFKTPPPNEVRAAVLALEGEDDRLRFHGRELYWARRGRMSDSPVFDGMAKATRGHAPTTRKATTLARLLKKFRSSRG